MKLHKLGPKKATAQRFSTTGDSPTLSQDESGMARREYAERLVSPGVTFAADALYRMLYADEVESFKQDQDAMIVGQLIDKQGTSLM